MIDCDYGQCVWGPHDCACFRKCYSYQAHERLFDKTSHYDFKFILQGAYRDPSTDCDNSSNRCSCLPTLDGPYASQQTKLAILIFQIRMIVIFHLAVR